MPYNTALRASVSYGKTTFTEAVSSLVSEKKIFVISANQSILLALAAMLNIQLERKNSNFVEDHPRNIPAKFGSNWPSGFGDEA